jgi:hypothetical protein
MNRDAFDHDQLFKQVLEAFFADFLRLFDPATAARLDLSTVTFRSTEVFTDIPQGERRTADIVAEARTLEGDPEIVLLHTEIQRERRRDFAYRMWQYYVLLRQRENLPVIPIALVFYPGRDSIAREEYRESVFGETIVTFRFLQISLPRLSGAEYVEGLSVLGAGLAAVMGLPQERPAQVRLHITALRRVLDAARAGDVDAAQAFLLGNLIDTYLPLSVEEQAELRVQLGQGDRSMGTREWTWADQLALETRLAGERRTTRHLIQRKFGRVPPDVEREIESITTEEELMALFDRALAAVTEADLLRPSS